MLLENRQKAGRVGDVSDVYGLPSRTDNDGRVRFPLCYRSKWRADEVPPQHNRYHCTTVGDDINRATMNRLRMLAILSAALSFSAAGFEEDKVLVYTRNFVTNG